MKPLAFALFVSLVGISHAATADTRPAPAESSSSAKTRAAERAAPAEKTGSRDRTQPASPRRIPPSHTFTFM